MGVLRDQHYQPVKNFFFFFNKFFLNHKMHPVFLLIYFFRMSNPFFTKHTFMVIMMLNMVHWLVGTVNRWLLHDATNMAMQHQHGWLHVATSMAMQHQHHHQPMNSTKRKCSDPTQWASQSVVHYTTPAIAARKGQGIKICIHTETEIHIQRPNYISKDQNTQQNKDQKTWTNFYSIKMKSKKWLVFMT